MGEDKTSSVLMLLPRDLIKELPEFLEDLIKLYPLDGSQTLSINPDHIEIHASITSFQNALDKRGYSIIVIHNTVNSNQGIRRISEILDTDTPEPGTDTPIILLNMDIYEKKRIEMDVSDWKNDSNLDISVVTYQTIQDIIQAIDQEVKRLEEGDNYSEGDDTMKLH